MAVNGRITTIAILAAALVSATPAAADLLITIDKAQQRMIVAKDGMPLYDWPVSTGQRNYDTPAGEFKPFRMEADHYSREWDDAPMPHSIFFTQIGHAIHGSFDIKHLGRPASHGCVRLHPDNAAILFKLVRAEKMANTRVVLTGTIPGGPGIVKNVLGVDPYLADEALVSWARPMPVYVEEKAAPVARTPRVERTRHKPQRTTTRYYYYEEPREERRPRGLTEFFFGR
jgi:lipoprotein-anchoring transpeptidase ErfK/SrfK